MQFTNESLDEFRTIYRQVFGEEITIEEARQMGLEITLLYKEMSKTLPRERVKKNDPEDIRVVEGEAGGEEVSSTCF
ncbi:MAG: hypothetical protein AAB690_01675 [Patescibacteria group bacterium]